eukprot:1430630-Rhodomonas_salina.2
MAGSDICCVLRACYEMSNTEVGYGATSIRRSESTWTLTRSVLPTRSCAIPVLGAYAQLCYTCATCLRVAHTMLVLPAYA